MTGFKQNLPVGTSGAVVPLLSTANTWSASQTIDGLTTTSPSVFAQITGDTFPRIRLGLNNSDLASISMGTGAVARNLFLEYVAAGSYRWGQTDAASPVPQIESVQGVIAGTTDTAGALRTWRDSGGTGTGTSGGWSWQTHPAGSTSSSQNALATAMSLRPPAASVPALRLNATPFIGGTATTTFPLYLLSPTGTTNVSSWSTNGTQFGINANSGFVGSMLDLHVAGGASVWSVDYTGAEVAKSLVLNGATLGADTMALTGSVTISGAISHGTEINTGNGAASISQVLWNGTVFTGGSGTTTFPAMFVQPTGTTAVTTWSTSGTVLGVNAPSGFGGRFLDFHIAGAASTFSVDSSGALIAPGGVTSAGGLNATNNRVAMSGNRSTAAWTTAGQGFIQSAATWTDTSSSGTIAVEYINVFLAPTLAFSSATTVTNAYNTYFVDPVQGTNATLTTKWALGADSLRVGGGTTISSAGALLIKSGASLTLGNAATTGLTAGVLSALTNSSIVIIDSTGQAYRIPCII